MARKEVYKRHIIQADATRYADGMWKPHGLVNPLENAALVLQKWDAEDMPSFCTADEAERNLIFFAKRWIDRNRALKT